MNKQSNQGNKIIIIIVIVVVVLAGIGAAWYWGMYKPAQEAKEKARQEQLAKAAAEKKRKEEEAQKKAKYDQLISEATSEFDQENWEMAYSLYSEAASLFPNEQYPQDQLSLINAKLDEIAALEAKKAAGIVETVNVRTGRFYVIVSSSVDDDLAMDYARKLAREGHDVKVIEHNAVELPFYGVAVGDYATWDEALTTSESLSGFENGAWVLKY